MRAGLLDAAAFAGACWGTVSAGVTGEGRLFSATLSLRLGRFSCELGGSIASLLGTGVMVLERTTLAIELDFVVSRRQGDEAASSALAVAARCVEGVPLRTKKPRMLCCLPVDGAGARLAGAGVRAGVEPAIA